MWWLNKERQRPFYAYLLLQEGHGQWETVERKVSNTAYSSSVFIYDKQMNTKH